MRAGEDLRKLALSGTFTFGLMLALSSLHNRSECGEIFRTAHTPFRMLLPTPFQERTRLSRSEALPGLQRVLVLRQNDQRDCQDRTLSMRSAVVPRSRRGASPESPYIV